MRWRKSGREVQTGDFVRVWALGVYQTRRHQETSLCFTVSLALVAAGSDLSGPCRCQGRVSSVLLFFWPSSCRRQGGLSLVYCFPGPCRGRQGGISVLLFSWPLSPPPGRHLFVLLFYWPLSPPPGRHLSVFLFSWPLSCRRQGGISLFCCFSGPKRIAPNRNRR